jgi:hypothetical protein
MQMHGRKNRGRADKFYLEEGGWIIHLLDSFLKRFRIDSSAEGNIPIKGRPYHCGTQPDGEMSLRWSGNNGTNA